MSDKYNNNNLNFDILKECATMINKFWIVFIYIYWSFLLIFSFCRTFLDINLFTYWEFSHNVMMQSQLLPTFTKIILLIIYTAFNVYTLVSFNKLFEGKKY